MKSVSMGVKCRAAVAIVFILLLLGTLWIYGKLENRLDACPKFHNPKDKMVFNRNVSDPESTEWLDLCPGQTFQVALLFSHLQSAPLGPGDVLMEHYLSSWDELIKFMTALGPLVGAVTAEIETKTSIIRQLAKEEEERMRTEGGSGMGGGGGGGGAGMPGVGGILGEAKSDNDLGVHLPSAPTGGSTSLGAYDSVESMIAAELSRGQVDYHTFTNSGCRTLLRLHRALLWLQQFLSKLSEGPDPHTGAMRSPSDLCADAYKHTLANHHQWWVRRMAELAFLSMPDRTFFYRLICVQDQEEATVILRKVVNAIDVVYNRTEKALEQHGMLDLP